MSLTFDARSHLARTAVWRTKLVEKFPHDARNQLANRMLSKLVLDDDSNVTQQTLDALTPYAKTNILNNAFQAETRLIGFSSNPESLDEFLQQVLDYIRNAAPAPAGATLANGLPTAVIGGAQ